MKTIHLDVAIAGGGLAGCLFAWHLKHKMPQLRIGLFEKKTLPSYKVGESTVEIASHYMIRKLGLSSYLYDRHLPKNGNRFFFDNSEKNADLVDMSEIGSTGLPYHPSFQVNRARLETDLLEMNRKIGVDVHVGGHIDAIELTQEGASPAAHSFVLRNNAAHYQCQWFIDASGRSALLAKQLRLRVPETDHQLAAVWGRFLHVADLDTAGSEDFRNRIRCTSRMLSTNHFCYPGYWIWFIPLGNKITSVGIVTERTAAWDPPLRKEEGFVKFLNQHRAIASLLQDAELIDISHYTQLSYKTRKFFDGNRWGVIGEAAAFTDPFYSPGSDFIALENDFLVDLIERDFKGETRDNLKTCAELYEAYMQFRYEASMRLYRHLYSLLGSYELFKVKWQLDVSLYYQMWVSQFMQDLHLNHDFLRQQLQEAEGILNVLENFSRLFQKVEQALVTRGEYFRLNLGQFMEALSGIDFVHDVGMPTRVYLEHKRLHHTLDTIRTNLCALLSGEGDTSDGSMLPLSKFLESNSLG